MAKLENMKSMLSNAGCDKRFVDSFNNGALWASSELTDFLQNFLSGDDYKYIDSNNSTNFLYSFITYLTDKKTE